MKKVLLVLILSLTFCWQAFAQTFTAKANRDEIPAGELFVLILNYQGPKNTNTPDLSILEKNFTIYSVSSSERSQSTNGMVNYSKQWELSLISNKSDGEIYIPAINLGNIYSNPLNLKINNNPTQNNETTANGYNNPNANSPKYSIDVKIDNKNPFVQQQVKYSIFVEDAGSLQISQPQFSDEQKNEWVIKSVGAPSIKTKTENKISLREIRFDYVIFPQKSGTLKIPEAKIDGYYLTQAKDQNFTGNLINRLIKEDLGDMTDVLSDIFAQKNPVMLKTKTTSIEVKPNPNIANLNWWLPAKDVKMTSKWETPISEFKVGEAISRKIEIQATGVIDTQIPNLKFKDIDDIKQYPEKPIIYSSIVNGDVVSVAEISNVYIPTKSGKITIPNLELYWFNTASQQLEKAFLEEIVIDVKPNTSYKSEDPAEVVIEPKTTNSHEDNIIVNTEAKDNNYLLIIGAFIIGIAISYLVFKPKKMKKPVEKSFKVDYRKNVILSAQQNNLKTLRTNLISWASEYFKDDKIYNLSDINKHTKNKEFEKQLETISANLYSIEQNDWDSKFFISIFEKINNNKFISYSKSTVLPELYK